jgi:hypothetical protein
MELRIARAFCARLAAFFVAEDGLVTVEWVALAGSLLIGAITVGWLVESNMQPSASSISNTLTACEQAAKNAGGSTAGC